MAEHHAQEVQAPRERHLRVTATSEPCWKCRRRLLKLEPDYHGWRYYCPHCRHATALVAELERGMREKDPSALGIVVAIPLQITLVPCGAEAASAESS